MRTTVLFASAGLLLAALPAQARDTEDLTTWSVEELCEKKDKARHAEAVLAELERRDIFNTFELELIREGGADIGMGEAALQCSWGEPRGSETLNGDNWQVYYQRRNGYQRRLLLRIDSSFVAEIRPVSRTASIDPSLIVFGGDYDTFSGRQITSQGVSSLNGGVSNPYDAGQAAAASEAARASGGVP